MQSSLQSSPHTYSLQHQASATQTHLAHDKRAQPYEFFIINLASSLDRRAKMEQNIAQLFANATHTNRANDECKDECGDSRYSGSTLESCLRFTFFQAITPSDIRESGFIKRYNRFFAGVYKAREVRESEMACFASHYALWQKCIEMEQSGALGEHKGIFIIEDDVDFCDGFMQGVERIAQSPYEYVRLAYTTFHTLYLVEEHFALAPKLMLGTTGYYITPSAARKFLKGAESICCAVDYYMSFSFLHNVAEMVYIPHIVQINELDEVSTIGKPEHQKKDKGFYYRFVLLREIHRFYRDMRLKLFAIRALRDIKRLQKTHTMGRK